MPAAAQDLTALPHPLSNVWSEPPVFLRYSTFKLVFCLLLLVLGAFSLFFRRKAWFLGRGWQYKNVQPSDLVLKVNWVLGGLAMVLAVVWFFFL